MTDVLVALADDRVMGEVRRSRSGRLRFVYDAGWQETRGACPLSFSTPFVVAEHEHGRIEPWLWGLLPDNEAVLARWGQRFQVSSRNAFALIGAVGEDCAGAVQFVLRSARRHSSKPDTAPSNGSKSATSPNASHTSAGTSRHGGSRGIRAGSVSPEPSPRRRSSWTASAGAFHRAAHRPRTSSSRRSVESTATPRTSTCVSHSLASSAGPRRGRGFCALKTRSRSRSSDTTADAVRPEYDACTGRICARRSGCRRRISIRTKAAPG